MFKKLSLIIIFVCLIFSAHASHFRGGEITWTCLGSGQFIFKTKFYRDCSGSAMSNFLPFSLTVYNNPNLSTIPMNVVSQQDQSDVCGVTCSSGSNYAIEEFIFESNPITLTGVPPAQGWVFVYSSSARNCTDNIQNTCPSTSSSVGFTLRAIMYPYSNTTTNTCFDSSPDFAEKPKSTLCAGSPFTFNHNANDADLDSLVYSFANPLEVIAAGTTFSANNPAPATFASPFSTTNPFPGNPVINPSTGDISFNSSQVGSYVTVVKVASYRCNQLIAEVFREIQIILYACTGTNNYPVLTPPFQDPNTLLYTLYEDTVSAGTLVNFTLSATDDATQVLTMLPSGNEFGANFSSNATGCLKPPCATLNPAPPATGLTGTGSVSTQFNWQTSCSHINAAISANCNALISNKSTYNFLFKIKDNYCSVNATSYGVVRITVLGTPLASSPMLRCASVNNNGSVSLNWRQASDPSGSFDKYFIYRAPSAAGPFTIIDSISNINTLTYTDAGVNAQSQSYFYYIKTRSGCFGQIFSPPLDTLKTIKVNVVDPANGTAIINWNKLHTPELATSTSKYKVYKKVNNGAWVQIGSTFATTYTDTITLCSDSIFYKVSLDDSLACTSQSSYSGGYFSDLISPNVPDIDSASVDVGTGLTTLGWTPSSSGDVNSYIIFFFNGSSFSAIDTVNNVSSYIDNANPFANSNASDGMQMYEIAALDSCGNISLITTFHNTLYLTSSLDNCNDEVVLTWNEYSNWQGGVLRYDIFESKNGSVFRKVGSTTATTYTHNGLQKGNNYCYYVRAFSASGNKSAASNKTCEFSRVPDQAAFIHLSHVTVLSDNKIEVKCFTDTSADVLKYKVLRSNVEYGSFLVADYVASSPSDPFIYFTDTDVITDSISYHYRVTVLDSCGAESITSNIGRSILLKVKPYINLKNELTWSDYKVWPNEVSHYNIYRSVNGKSDPKLIASVNGNTTTYEDNVSEFPKETGLFCYYVTAYENGPNAYGISDSSKSNFACSQQEPTLYIPNAFNPSGGINPVFKPVSMYVDRNSYSLVIYNRWGSIVFQTSDPEEGWDGKKGGDWCPSDVYTYLLKFKNSEGIHTEKRGIVTLIR